MSNIALTAGGLAVSLAATGFYGWQWWKSPGRKPADLAPFAGSYILGGLATVCGGVLGVLSGWTALAGNGLGKHAVTSTAGGKAAVMNHGTAGVLTPGGHIVAFLLAFACFIAWRAAAKTIKRRIFWGWFAGSTMMLTVGMALLFAHVVALVNGIGDTGYGWFNHGGGA
jgi:ABC-type sulfate transport system permease component